MVTCFHCREPLDDCRRTMLRDATDRASRELGFAELVAWSSEDQATGVVAAWDAALAVNELLDLIVAQNYGITVEAAYERARALIEEEACA